MLTLRYFYHLVPGQMEGHLSRHHISRAVDISSTVINFHELQKMYWFPMSASEAAAVLAFLDEIENPNPILAAFRERLGEFLLEEAIREESEHDDSALVSEAIIMSGLFK